LSDSLSVQNLSVHTLLSVLITRPRPGPLLCTDKEARGKCTVDETPLCTDNKTLLYIVEILKLSTERGPIFLRRLQGRIQISRGSQTEASIPKSVHAKLKKHSYHHLGTDFARGLFPNNFLNYVYRFVLV